MLAFSGASVRVETDKGKLFTRQVMGSIGLMTDQTSTLFFGLGEAARVKRVTVETRLRQEVGGGRAGHQPDAEDWRFHRAAIGHALMYELQPGRRVTCPILPLGADPPEAIDLRFPGADDAHDIPDQRERADCPETPVNATSVFIVHRVRLVSVTPQTAHP